MIVNFDSLNIHTLQPINFKGNIMFKKVACGILFLTGCCSAQASQLNLGQTWNLAPTGGTFDVQENARSGPLSVDRTVVTNNVRVHMFSYADYGILRSYSYSFNSGGFAAAESGVAFSDWITIDAPGLTGTIGSFTGGSKVHASLSPSLSAHEGSTTEVDVYAFINGINMEHYEVFGWNPDGTQISYEKNQIDFSNIPYDGNLEGIIPFKFGVPFLISMNLRTRAQSYTDPNSSEIGSGNAMADASNTVYWLGIDNVLSGNGRVDDFSVVSDSGTNYARSFIPTSISIPEPSTLSIMLVGVLITVGLLRRT